VGEEKRVQDSDEKKSFGKPKRRWRNIKLYLEGIGCGGLELIRLAENRTK
jgi:hypothetical protein